MTRTLKDLGRETKKMFAKEIFDAHIDGLGDWVVGDIRRCCRLKTDGQYESNGAMVGAFVLWVCAIDYLGGLLTNNHNDSSVRMMVYITEYLNKARPQEGPFYKETDIFNLRNGIVHSYSPPNFLLTNSQSKRLHLTTQGGYTWLVLECVIDDMEKAFVNFRNDLLSNEKILLKAFDYSMKFPPLSPSLKTWNSDLNKLLENTT